MVDQIERNSHEVSSLNNQQFRLNKINDIKNYFFAEIKERELMTKILSKYIAVAIILISFYQQQVVVFLLHYLQQLLEHLLE